MRTKIAFLLIALSMTLYAVMAGPMDQLHEGCGGRHSLWRASQATSHRLPEVTSIAPGKSKVVAEMAGPGVIKHIWITAMSEIPQAYGMMTLKMYWDGEKQPSVKAPLGDFFGVGYGKEVEFKSLMVEMSPAGGPYRSSLNSYWEMPFGKSAKIEIENRSLRMVNMFFIQVDYEKPESLPEDALYFHACYNRENPVEKGEPYTILEAKGRGNYVGTILNYHLLGPGAWVEGGQAFYIDGEEEPSLPGTGGEDYFGHAWGFRHENSALLHGTSYGLEENKMTAYRFHIPDPVHFKKSIRATIRCHGWDVGDREDDYSSVAIWYQDEPHEPLPDLPPVDYDLLEVDAEFRKSLEEIYQERLSQVDFEGENLALEAVDYAESGHNEIFQTGKKAFDGDLSTKWCELKNPDDHWLALDLGSERQINGFVLENPGLLGDQPGFNLVEFKIQKGESLEGPWETVVERNLVEEAGGEEKYDQDEGSLVIIPMEEKIRTRYVRLYITDAGILDAFARVQEFEVWGRPVKSK